jgi:hypothetical protein
MSCILNTFTKIKLPKGKGAAVICELLENYTGGAKWELEDVLDANEIIIGEPIKAEICDGEYVLNINSDGVYIKGVDYPSLMRGFMAFLAKIKCSAKDGFYAEKCTEQGKPEIGFRAAHLCIFPETKFEFFKKCVRTCAFVKYTHIVFEFWGMIKYDVMKELSWPFAYTKDEVREIVDEANALGVEVIPMFNHLGHAAGCREINGKHVVLNQNPKYEYMFESYGWVWDFSNPEVYDLLKEVRRELIDVCGEGKYFHIGCDEAYMYGHNPDRAKMMVGYVNKIADELKELGRRPIIWHDMFLSHEDCPGYVANASKEVSDIVLAKLDKSFIVADWQYDRHKETWKTSPKFSKDGFDVVCCPWHTMENVQEAVATIKENNLYGIIHTTWHTLYTGYRELVYAGILSWGKQYGFGDAFRFYCAEISRKVLFTGGVYEDAGWSDKMVGPGL